MVSAKRILYVTSKVWDWCESQSCAEHFAHAPYSTMPAIFVSSIR